MGTPNDLSLAVPGSGPPVAVPAIAGSNPEPMEDDSIRQPVVAYFTFIQNNLAQLTSGNAQQVMREAEQRHMQIMNEVILGLRNEMANRIAQRDQEWEQRVQDAESSAIAAGLAATAEARKHTDDLQARLSQAQALHDAAVQQIKDEADAKHEQKIAEVRSSISKEFEETYKQTVDHAAKAVAASKKQYEDQLAVEQARFIQMKHEFEAYKRETSDKLNEAAAQNLSLQDQIDDLNDQLAMVAKVRTTASGVVASGSASAPKPKELAAGNSMPMHFDIGTPKVAEAGTKAIDGEPIQEIKTPAVMAQEAKEKLDKLLKTGDLERPAAGDGKPLLPMGSGFYTPTEPVKTPPNDSPKSVGKQQQMMGATDLIELVKALTSRDEKDKPKTKEAEVIKLNNMPAPESYRNWKNHVRDEVKSCSDRPDEAWAWLNEVYDQSISREELEKRLQDPGKFLTLDTKLSAALTRSAGGDLATRILNYKENQSRKGVQVRGRYVLLMFEDYFKTSEEAGSLYRVEDLLGVYKVGDTVQDLRRFVNKWDATLAGMATAPDDAVLRDILLRQIRPSQLLKYDIEVFDRAAERSHEKSYEFLHQSMKNLIDRERLRENRNRIAEKNKAGHKDLKVAPAKGDGRSGRKGSPSRGRSSERGGKGEKICYKFQEGKCDKGKNCPFKHVKDKGKGRTQSPKGRGRTRSPSKGGKKDDKRKKLSREEMAKTPCTYFAQGKCNRGDKCFYKHEEKGAAATKDTKRTNSPAPKKKAKDSNATPCIKTSTHECMLQKFACIAKKAPRAISSSKSSEVSMKRIRFRKHPQVFEIKAVGNHAPVRHRPREYTTVYRTPEEVPVSSKVEQHEAQVRARQLQETVKLHDSNLKPSCDFCCWDEDTGDATCKECRFISGPKNLRDIARYPAIATAAPKAGVCWLVDSGSESDLVSKGMLRDVNAKNCRAVEHPISLITANGSTEANEVADVKLSALPDPVQPYVLDQTPAVLSVGTRCVDQGYSFVWPANGNPILVRPDDKVVQLRVEGHVPVLDDSCQVFTKEQFHKDKHLRKLFAMPTSRSRLSENVEADEEQLDELVTDDVSHEYARSKKPEDLIAEAASAKHQFTHFPKNPFCRTCQRARMMAPHARNKGGQKRIETEMFGDHIIGDHVIIKKNVEEGFRGEQVALVLKDLHTQYRFVYPSQSKDAQSSVDGLNHFIGPKDDVQVVYTDNSPELIRAIKDLGYRHQTSIEYVDSSKSFAEREVRQMLEGARSNLLQSGLPLKMWPLAMQHHATAVNASPQLDGSESPWQLRFGEEFPAMHIPFGAKVLFWNNPKRLDNTSGKLSPTSNEGLFLGYHIQPGHAWKGEYLVAKLEAADYHVNYGALTIQRTKRLELPDEGFVFPLKALIDSKAPKADRLEDQVIPPTPTAVPLESEMLPPPEDNEYSPGTPIADAGGDAEPVEEPIFPDLKLTPKGDIIPDGFHWDGHRIVRNYRGSKRPEGIDSKLWQMLSPSDRKKIIEEEEAKALAEARKGKPAPSKPATSSAKSTKGKKSTVATLEATQSLPARAKLVGDAWEIIPENSPKFSVPAMPKVAMPAVEVHRPQLRELVKQKIKELEFKNALELFASVARLVTKDEISKNPKARAALDKEWQNLQNKGVWDESRVRECRDIVSEARRKGETVHLGRIFEACYEKGSELPESDPRRKFKGRTVFQGNNVRDENSDHALFNELGSSPASMEAAKLLDAFGSQPGFSKAQADAIQAYIQALFTGVPTWLSLPRNRWPKDWEKKYWQPMVPMLLALYGHPDSGGIWEQHLNSRVEKQGWKQVLPDIWHSIFHHQEYNCLLVVYVDDFKMAGPSENMAKAWASIKKAVDIGEPEPYDRYFGCMHREFQNIHLPKEAHPFAFAFDAKTSASAMHRTQDWWEHDEQNKAWIRHHIQPRKRLYQPGDEGGECSNCSQRITFFDKKVTLKGCSSITDRDNQGGLNMYVDDWKTSKDQSSEFWTGKTVFCYGQDGPDKFKEFAMASKARPGPHRDKREAKKEAKAAKFRGLNNAVKPNAGVMAKPVNLVRYDMSNFLESCVENYCKLAKVSPSSLKEVPTPFTDAGIARPTLSEDEKPGKLQPVASKILMKILFAARMARFDLLRATQSLASRVTKWSVECDVALHRLVAYINCTKHHFLEGFIGDSFDKCQLWLFADADHAGEHDSKSTSGSAIVLVGPNTYYPLNAFSKKQTVVAISSTEAEVVAANHSMRAEGIPMLALFEQLNLFGTKQGKPARPTAKPDADTVFTRIDPEIDDIRNGNVDTGCSVADINSLKASFPEFYQVKFMEDNQATITVMSTGSSASMRHMNKTQNINFKWLKQQFECKQFDLLNVGTNYQVADILTKAFTRPALWQHAIQLISIGPTKVEEEARRKAKPSSNQVPKVASAAGNQGGPSKNHVPRMLIEFCCSEDSKLSTQRKSSEGCHCIRVTEKEDGTLQSSRQRLASQIQDFKNDFHDGTLILYASLPCVGGSPWGNVNGLTVEGQDRIKEQQKLFTKLFKSFVKLVHEVADEKTLIAFELSRNCKYWGWPMVRKFLIEHSMSMHHFDGCMLGVLGNNDLPMKKGWTIAGNFKELSKLDSFKCDGTHTHAESRGKSLKLAENYTFRLTDLLHDCFHEAASGQASKRNHRVCVACPAKIADMSSSTFDAQFAATDSAGREAMLEAQLEHNRSYWQNLFGKILTALVMKRQGESADSEELATGLLSEWTPLSAVRFYGKGDPIAEAYEFALLAEELGIERLEPPKAISSSGTVWILVSDSSTALITGRGKSLKKYDLTAHFQERKPTYVAEFIHEMMWGKNLQALVKRAIQLVREVIQKYGENVRINLHVAWFGNELVGRGGIAPQPSWPYEDGDGVWPDLLDTCMRHLTWFKGQCDQLKIQTAGLTTAPLAADYGIHPIFDQFYAALKGKFLEKFALEGTMVDPRFAWIDATEYAVDMEFKDQWHFINSDENRLRLSSFWSATMFIQDIGSTLIRSWDKLQAIARRDWYALRKNPSFILEEMPESYVEKVKRATKMIFGESKRFVPLVGTKFTSEDVRLRQPDTENHQDPDEMSEDDDDEPTTAAGDGKLLQSSPKAKASPPVEVSTRTVTLKSASAQASGSASSASASAADAVANADVTDLPETSKATSRLAKALPKPTKYVRSYFMEDHLPEYEYTMVINADHQEVPGILFRGVAYELERVTAADARSIVASIAVDKKFNDYATRVNKVCRGTANCSNIEMTKDLWIDLEDFAKAFRKEVPPSVGINVRNLVGVALKEDKFAKSRFELLCARVENLPYDSHLQCEWVPVMIKAIQGHSDAALRKAGGLFASAQIIFCADNVSPERKAAFAGVPVAAMDDVPEVAFHRTMKSHWKSIAKNGLIPGGGDTVNSGRAHVYLSDKRFGSDGYRSGLRGKCPIEIKVAVRQAVAAGVIFSKSKMDGIMTAEQIPSQFIVSVYDTQNDTMLWSRASSNLDSSSWQQSSSVSLVARNDRDLGDEPDDDDQAPAATGSGQPDASPDDSRKRGRDLPDREKQPPPSRARRVYLEVRQKEPFTGYCPVCMVDYISGQQVCTTCGFDDLPVDESGEVKPKEPNRRSQYLSKRAKKLAEFGIHGSVSQSMLNALTQDQVAELAKEMGRRGLMSLESTMLKDSRDRHRRAKELGYEGVEDRYDCDAQFCDRMHQEGKDVSNCVFDDMFAYAHLPDPPRTRPQFVAGVAANAANENVLTKLLFVKNPKGHSGYPAEFKDTWIKPWGFIFGRKIFTQVGYEQYLEKKGAYRNLLTWRGVVTVPHDNVSDFLESIYVQNHEAAITNIERKEKQSQIAKKRNAEQASQTTATGSGSAQADASSPAVPAPKTPPKAPPSRSAQADAPQTQSWSWNRDHYGSRREWTQWRGNWYYRDDSQSRWIYWGR